MPRAPRINSPDGVYQVTSRGNGRDVGIHYGGISAPAVSNIRRRVRERQDSIQLAVVRLAETIRKAELATAEMSMLKLCPVWRVASYRIMDADTVALEVTTRSLVVERRTRKHFGAPRRAR